MIALLQIARYARDLIRVLRPIELGLERTPIDPMLGPGADRSGSALSDVASRRRSRRALRVPSRVPPIAGLWRQAHRADIRSAAPPARLHKARQHHRRGLDGKRDRIVIEIDTLRRVRHEHPGLERFDRRRYQPDERFEIVRQRAGGKTEIDAALGRETGQVMAFDVSWRAPSTPTA